MIKLKKDMETLRVENIGNVEGVILKEQTLTPAEMLNKALMFNKITIPVGSKIKEHPHCDDAEIYYILEGDVKVTDNDTTIVLAAGDAMFTANGDTHSIENIGTTDATFLAVILK